MMMANILEKVARRIDLYRKSREYNNPQYQCEHWRDELSKHDWEADELYGYDWGNPDDANDRLGNYLDIKNRVVRLATPDRTVVDLGSLGGKWTQYMVKAKKIICVDINQVGFEYIRKKLPFDHISFYLTKGNELNGIADNSVDIVFSVDVLVRVPKKFIDDYFREMKRVLKPKGRLFIHLPCTLKKECERRLFVHLSLKEIHALCRKYNFQDILIDQDVLKHGVILEAEKPLE